MPAIIKRIFEVTGIVVLAAVALLAAWDYSWEEPGQETSSQSEAMAVSRGTWRGSLQASPPTFEVQGQVFHINSAWLEQKSHRAEILWVTYETPIKGCSLCFTLAEHSIPTTHLFTAGDDTDPITEGIWPNTIVTYTADLERPEDATHLQFTVEAMRPVNDPNTHSFKFTTKP